MALVSYSESESEPEAPPSKPPPSKKPFQKVVDRSNGKIIVNLTQPSASSSSSTSASASASASASTPDDQPPAKRARTADSSGGLFKGFNSFLPPPKNHLRSAPIKPAAAAASSSSSSSGQTPRPGIHLKTSAEVGFARADPEHDHYHDDDFNGRGGSDAPVTRAQPSVSEDLKPAAEVKLVGKPLMFKPLSVARPSTKKKPKPATPTPPSSTSTSTSTITTSTPSSTSTNSRANITTAAPAAGPAPRKSLFSLHVEEPPSPSRDHKPSSHDPLDFASQQAYFTQHTQQPQFQTSTTQYQNATQQPPPAAVNSLRAAADDLNLSPSARRELFGRNNTNTNPNSPADPSILTLNMDREYQHNELLRAAGDQQLHNPVRAIQGGGKHSLRQLVHNVVNQREALEDSFAKGKSNRKEASNKYGW